MRNCTSQFLSICSPSTTTTTAMTWDETDAILHVIVHECVRLGHNGARLLRPHVIVRECGKICCLWVWRRRTWNARCVSTRSLALSIRLWTRLCMVALRCRGVSWQILGEKGTLNMLCTNACLQSRMERRKFMYASFVHNFLHFESMRQIFTMKWLSISLFTKRCRTLM